MSNKIGAFFLIVFSLLGAFFWIQYIENKQTEADQKKLLDRELEKNIPNSSAIQTRPHLNSSPQGEDETNTPSPDKERLGGGTLSTENSDPSISQESIELLQTEELTYIYPDTFNIPVTFHSQSPLGMWGKIFGETCEEASVLLAMSYFQGPLYTAREFRDELLKIVDWQNEVFGDYRHTSVVQTGQILGDFYQYKNYKVIDNPTVEEMKYHIAGGSLILAPFYGIGLNPYYSGVGPEYHFMMIKGYTRDTFITHDVGTKRGADYEYSITTLMERIHDYHPESIQLGAKKILIVSQM